MPQNLTKVEFTTLQQFVSAINANFAIIQNSPLFKGIPGESVQGDKGDQGQRGGKFLFVRFANFSQHFTISSSQEITVEFLQQNSDETHIQDLLESLQTDDLIDGDVIVLESTTELIEVSTDDETQEYSFLPTGIFLSQEIQSFATLTQMYNNVVALLQSIDIEQNVVIDRFETIALGWGHPSSANVQETSLQASSVYYPFIQGISDFYNAGVNMTNDSGPYNHFYYSLSKEKYNGIHNYTFVNGNVQDLIHILDLTTTNEQTSTTIEHLPTKDFIPSNIILQNSEKEGMLIGNKNGQMNNFSRLFKNNENELIITTEYEHNTSINNGNINHTNYDMFNYGVLMLCKQQLIWNKKFFNYGTFELQGDFIQNLFDGEGNKTLTNTPHLKTRNSTITQGENHIDFGFYDQTSLKPYSNSLLTIFSEDIKFIDSTNDNAFRNIFLFTDDDGKLRKDVFKESALTNGNTSYVDYFGSNGYTISKFLLGDTNYDGIQRSNYENNVVTSNYLSALARLIIGIQDINNLPSNVDICNFQNVWLKQDFGPGLESYNGHYGYQRIPSIHLNKELIVGKNSNDNNDHTRDQIFRVLQPVSTNNPHTTITIGNLAECLVKQVYEFELGQHDYQFTNDTPSDTIIFAKWKELYFPGVKPRTVLTVSNTSNNFGEVTKKYQYADMNYNQNISTQQPDLNKFPTDVTEDAILQHVENYLNDETVDFEFYLSWYQNGKYIGGDETHPMRQKFLTGSHWRILWGAIDRLRKWIRNNYYNKNEIDSFVSPIGSVIAWTPLQELENVYIVPSVTIPKGWVPCFGGYVILSDGKRIKVPDLTKKFVLGEHIKKMYINSQSQAVCNGGLISSNKYDGRNYTYIKESEIPPHIHQHTHNANGLIRVRVVAAKKDDITPVSGTGGGYIWFKDWNQQITPVTIDVESSIYQDRKIIDTTATNNDVTWGTTNPSNPTRSKYPKEWSDETRSRGNIDGTSTPKLVNVGLLPENSDYNPIDCDNNQGDFIPSNAHNWTGVYGGQTKQHDITKKVQKRFDLLSRHIKLIYIYKVGKDIINYIPDVNNEIQFTQNFDTYSSQ